MQSHKAHPAPSLGKMGRAVEGAEKPITFAGSSCRHPGKRRGAVPAGSCGARAWRRLTSSAGWDSRGCRTSRSHQMAAKTRRGGGELPGFAAPFGAQSLVREGKRRGGSKTPPFRLGSRRFFLSFFVMHKNAKVGAVLNVGEYLEEESGGLFLFSFGWASPPDPLLDCQELNLQVLF